MYELGWTSPGFFDHAGDELALQHAISRYHAFVSIYNFCSNLHIKSMFEFLKLPGSHGFISSHILRANFGYRSRLAHTSVFLC